jgi:spore coat protein H
MTRAQPSGGSRASWSLSLFAIAVLGCGGGDQGAVPGSGGNAGVVADASADGAMTVGKGAIGNVVFDQEHVASYYLTFSDAEYAKLMDLSTLLTDRFHVNEDRFVEASLRVGDVQIDRIGVRFKGDYSIWGCVDYATGQRLSRVDPFFGNIDVCQRFSLKLDLDRYVGAARLDGLKKLNLHAMAFDPSKMRERLGYSLFGDMGILAPRAAHARLYVNGQYQGLVAAVEQVDGRFTANRFPTFGDGNLYKEIWPNADLTQASAEAALSTNDDPGTANVSDLLAFRDAIAASTAGDFEPRMAAYVDLDALARYIVVDRAVTNYDGIVAFYGGYGAFANHNYYWYHDEGGGLWHLVPWDLDKTMWYPEPNFWSDNAPNGANVVPNWNVITSACDGFTCSFDAAGYSYQVRQIDCDPLLKLLRGAVYDRQQAIAAEFLAGPFSEATVKTKLDGWKAQIGQAIGEDPGVDPARWNASVDDLIGNLPKLRANVQLMMSGLIQQQ